MSIQVQPTTRNQFPTINVVVAKVLPTGEEEIFYPMFPSHLMMPIKSGEWIWVCYPDKKDSAGLGNPESPMGTNVERELLENRGGSDSDVIKVVRGATSNPPMFKRALVTQVYLSYGQVIVASGHSVALTMDKGGYWLSRICGSRISEDANFTAIDRDKDMRITCGLEGRTPADVVEGGEYFPSFPNGPTRPLEPVDSLLSPNNYTIGDNPAEVFQAIARASNSTHTFEPVPAFSKRPGDLVLQGSNNTAICLGEDKILRTDMSSGCIDLVAGRGLAIDSVNKVLHIANELGVRERDKCIELSEQEINMFEAETDLTDDLSRIYITSYTEPDSLFCNPESTGASEKITFTATAPSFEGRGMLPIIEDDEPAALSELALDIAGPTIAIKSDHVRIIGRETLRLMVENPEGGPNSAPEIILHKDGNIFIKPGIDGQVYLGEGPDAGEPDTATFADLVTYPDDVEGGPGFVAEMAVATKIPTRHSPKVKVKI
jgi:hypothetical protein